MHGLLVPLAEFPLAVDCPDPEPLLDPGYEALEFLDSLREVLVRAVRFRKTCQSEGQRWGEPAVFFFDNAFQRESSAARGPESSYLSTRALKAAVKAPADALAWRSLETAIGDMLPVLIESVEARRVARGLRGLTKAARILAADQPAARNLVALLDVVDDEVLRVIHAKSGRCFRLRLHGIESNKQLLTLLAELLIGTIGLAGQAPNPKAAALYRGRRQASGIVVHASFGMYRSVALRDDGTLATGLANSDEWIWPEGSPRDIPLIGGERVLVLGPPPLLQSWEVERRFPALQGDVEFLEELPYAAA